jgi:regulator of cell morphogenesis and NO signaling
MNLESNNTVRELAQAIPGATRVFEKVGIDYCCGGHRLLTEACATAKVNVEDVMQSLKLAAESNSFGEEPDFSTLTELIDHIIDTHHVFTRTEIVRLRALVNKVCGVHGQNNPELESVRTLFETLSLELEPHMMKEELVLFPYVKVMEAAVLGQRSFMSPPFGTVRNPEILKEIRRVTSNYTVPGDVCIGYQTLYQALEALEKDLHQHIHLENNVLFPRAVEMEAVVHV